MEGALLALPWVRHLARNDDGVNGVELIFGTRGGKKVTLSAMTPENTGVAKRAFLPGQLLAFPGILKALVLCTLELYSSRGCCCELIIHLDVLFTLFGVFERRMINLLDKPPRTHE